MNNDYKSPETEIADHQAIRESLLHLDRTILWFWWNTIVAIVLLLGAMAAYFDPQLAAMFSLPERQNASAIVGVLLFLALIANGYALYRQHQFKVFRDRLVEQMQGSVKQRMRAEKFYGLAILDPLTGLYNRRYGEECLQKEITRAEKNRYDLAVLVIDLDYFKEINDNFGHAAGDIVLKEFSRHLRRAIRACDVPVRIGGDEFVVVLPECPRENVHIILSRLKPFEVMVNHRKITVRFSRGHAQYQVGDTPQTIIQRADKVLYDAKAARSHAAV